MVYGEDLVYLLEFNGRFSIERNLRRYLRIDFTLYQDALFILREELEALRNYFAIIEAIAKDGDNLTGLNRG